MQPLFLHPRDLDIAAPHLFWAAPPDAALVDSLASLGQTTPALVVETGGRPILAAGSRRAAALRAIRGSALCAVAVSLDGPAGDDGHGPASVPDPAVTPAVRLGLYYLASNLGRAVTDAMAVAAGRYFTAHAGVDDFVRLAGPYLFAPDDRRARFVTRWLALPPSLDALLASGHVPLGTGELLAGLDGTTLEALTPLLGAVRWSRGSLAGAVTWITEATRLAGCPAATLLARCGVLDLPGRGLSPNDLTAGVLAGLRRLRYPALTTLEARFAALSRELARGSRVKVKASQGFESDAVTLEVTVKSPADLAKAATDMAAMASSPVLPRLLTVAHDDHDSEAPA
ncbi:chromosome partitioning protein ParB [Solidesulfovibrio sp.]